jgi:phosphate transport system permease protein
MSAVRRRWPERMFSAVCLAATLVPVLGLVWLVGGVAVRAIASGVAWLELWVWMTVAVVGAGVVMAFPVALGTALYLEEYGRTSRLARWVDVAVVNLAGVPTVLMGLLIVLIFDAPRLTSEVFTCGAALALVVLPLIVRFTREALRTVPDGVREAGLALGATRTAVLRRLVLPMAWPAILAGAVRATARALGEVAALWVLVLGAYCGSPPPPPPFTLSVQIFEQLTEGTASSRADAAAGIAVLLAMLFLLSALAIMLRGRSPGRFR